MAELDDCNLDVLFATVADAVEVNSNRFILLVVDGSKVLAKPVAESPASFTDVCQIAPLAADSVHEIPISAREGVMDLPDLCGEFDRCAPTKMWSGPTSASATEAKRISRLQSSRSAI